MGLNIRTSFANIISRIPKIVSGQTYTRYVNYSGSISPEAYPVKSSSQMLKNLAGLVGPEYINRLNGVLRKDFTEIMEDRAKYIRIYTGDDPNSHLVSKFTASVLEEVILAKTNLVDRAIRRMALVYKDQPEYNFGESKMPKGFEYPFSKRWIALKNAERLCNLLGTIAIRPVVRNDQLQWDVLWYFVPLLSSEDSLELDGIAYPLSGESNPKKWGIWLKTEERSEAYIGDIGDKSKVAFPGRKDINNPYEELPFTLIHPKFPMDACPFVGGYGGMLVDANDALIMGLTETRIGARFNMMGQFFTTGLDAKHKMKLGTNLIPNLGDGQKLEVLAPQGNFDGGVEYLRFEIENALQSIGLQIQWGTSADAPSGEALRVKAIEVLERREDDVPIWREADRVVYGHEQMIAKIDLKKNLPDLESINFAEMDFPKPISEEREDQEWRWEHGLDSKAKFLMREDPDAYKDEKEAQQEIRDNLQSNRRLGAAEMAGVFGGSES